MMVNIYREKTMTEKKPSIEATVKNIRQKSRKKYSAEEKIRIVLEGLQGE
jgi:transposase